MSFFMMQINSMVIMEKWTKETIISVYGRFYITLGCQKARLFFTLQYFEQTTSRLLWVKVQKEMV